ncbi:hypothetical protein BDFG_03426 [Blastomyces dermatitidis ATCC 26199]|nr:hypothetical protein BDFG_03426 [Blastomyces dermatitidis ATCC 26199]
MAVKMRQLTIGEKAINFMNKAEIAAICQQVLSGLSFIHMELGITHGAINTENVVLSGTGIGKAKGMRCTTSGAELDDTLGDMVAGLMIGSAGSHIFLQFSPGVDCLVPHVRVAVRNGMFAWRLIAAS